MKNASRTTFLVIVALFVGSLVLFTRNNTFPFTYHPDEDTKVHQIVTGKRNFFHPLLMLTTTDLAMKLGHIKKTPMNAAITGRWVSAVFTAMAVCALALLAWRWTGPVGGVLVGLLVALNPLVFELAHYFKEDPALLMGLAVSFLALDLFSTSPGRNSALFLGLGCALAISGKYLGIIVLLFVLPIIFVRSRQYAGWFAVGLFVPLIFINLPLLLDLPDFRRGLSREMEGATGGHRGLGRDVPHAYYFGRLMELTPWGLWAGLAVANLRFSREPRKWRTNQWLTLLFPFLFLAVLSFSPKTAGRYLLPVEAFFAFFVGVALVKSYPRFAIVPAVFIIWSTASMCHEYQMEFSHDARSDLRAWISQNLPATAILAEDGRVDLAADGNWKSPGLRTSEYAADLGSVADLRAQGVTQIAVARQTYNRYFNENLKPKPKEKAEFDRRAAFYRELFATGKPIWESPIGQVIYLHPGLRLYDIRPPAKTAD